MFECLLIQYGLILYSFSMDCKKIFEKILGAQFASKSKVFWGGRDPERRALLNARLRDRLDRAPERAAKPPSLRSIWTPTRIEPIE